MAEAGQLEAGGDLKAAEKIYLRVAKSGAASARAFSRLMVIYRKLKEYRKELAIVNSAIRAFEEKLLGVSRKWSAANRKAARISRQLASSLGVINRKGLPVNEDPLLAEWRKRKERLERRLAKR